MDKKQIKGPMELIKESLNIYFKGENLGYLIKATFAAYGLALIPIIVTVFVFMVWAGLLTTNGNGAMIALMTFVGIACLLISIIAALWAQIALIIAVNGVIKGEMKPISEILKSAWSGLIGRFFVLNLLVGLIVFFGFILLIIPGIIFAIWFMFSTYILIFEKKGILESIGRSRELVSGYFWSVLGYTALFQILTMIVVGLLNMVIPLVGSLITVVFSAYFIVFPLLLYREILAAKAK